MNNKWTRAAIPALLIHCSIGTVYCWSTFKQAIAERIGVSTFATGWAFSLAIFFLGMSAAIGGRLVEKDIHRSSLLTCICFTIGMIGTGFVIQRFHGVAALIGIYIFYGVIMGIGLGIGYLCPVKTLMLWFSDQRGLATGLSIMGFGLAKVMATPIMERLQTAYGISAMFYILGVVYFCMMFAGHMMLEKPEGWEENESSAVVFTVQELAKNKTFIYIWLMFFINIHCGLMLITYEKQLVQWSYDGVALAIVLVPTLTAAANAFGRVGYSTLSDRTWDRSLVYGVIFLTSLGMTAVAFVAMRFEVNSLSMLTWATILLVIINLGYGGGFSTLPPLLAQRFGVDDVSRIHGIALTAWSVAGITGNNTSEFMLTHFGGDYRYLLIVTFVLYCVGFGLSRGIRIKL